MDLAIYTPETKGEYHLYMFFLLLFSKAIILIQNHTFLI